MDQCLNENDTHFRDLIETHKTAATKKSLDMMTNSNTFNIKIVADLNNFATDIKVQKVALQLHHVKLVEMVCNTFIL